MFGFCQCQSKPGFESTQSALCPESMCLCSPLIQAKDPRIKVYIGSVRFIDLKETDEGTFSISLGGSAFYDVINLKILGENIALYCTFNSYIPSQNVCVNRYLY